MRLPVSVLSAAYQRAVESLSRRAPSVGEGHGATRSDAAIHYAAFNDSLRANGVYSEPSHETLQTLFASLPFAATRSGDELHPTRAALSDALREKGREQEADLAGDPTKTLRPRYDGPEHGWQLRERQRGIRSGGRFDTSHHAGTRQYLLSALWASHDDDGHPLDDRHEVGHFSDDAFDRADHDLHRFYSMLSPAAHEAAEQADVTDIAHTLWLSRNGHGVSFSDRDELDPDHAEEMDAAAKRLGEQDVEVEHHGDEDPDRDGEYTLHLYGGR